MCDYISKTHQDMKTHVREVHDMAHSTDYDAPPRPAGP